MSALSSLPSMGCSVTPTAPALRPTGLRAATPSRSAWSRAERTPSPTLARRGWSETTRFDLRVSEVASPHRGLDVVELPPNGQGLTALVLLNILEQFDVAKLDPVGPERLHLALEAARLAFGLRDAHISDPATMREPVAGLLDKDFAKKLSALLDPEKRVPLPKSPTPGSDTIYLTVVDRDRAAVSLINSLYSAFGTGICTEKTGVMLHNRGTGFVVEPGHPNTIEGGKRPMHTIIPALAMRNGRCEMPFGVMGADYQPSIRFFRARLRGAARRLASSSVNCFRKSLFMAVSSSHSTFSSRVNGPRSSHRPVDRIDDEMVRVRH